ncbi:hypothetical protein ACIOC2_01495 [Streptomyces sp. NPDC088337]|uniref:hypothetical protein n=1 Tax=unclassified Streptomyces TaxID=2593676 RepID=UPI0038144143
MAGTGPAPKPDDQRRRRNATVAMTTLPAAGRPGPAPDWPLLDDIALTARRDMARRSADDIELQLVEPSLTARKKTALQKRLDAARSEALILERQLQATQQTEVALWTELWRTPQAVEWERLGWVREVAQYVRWKARAEAGDLDASKEARQLADRLGLSPLAMLRLRWKVASPEEAAAATRAPAKRTASRGAQAKRRLRIVDKEEGA